MRQTHGGLSIIEIAIIMTVWLHFLNTFYEIGFAFSIWEE